MQQQDANLQAASRVATIKNAQYAQMIRDAISAVRNSGKEVNAETARAMLRGLLVENGAADLIANSAIRQFDADIALAGHLTPKTAPTLPLFERLVSKWRESISNAAGAELPADNDEAEDEEDQSTVVAAAILAFAASLAIRFGSLRDRLQKIAAKTDAREMLDDLEQLKRELPNELRKLNLAGLDSTPLDEAMASEFGNGMLVAAGKEPMFGSLESFAAVALTLRTIGLFDVHPREVRSVKNDFELRADAVTKTVNASIVQDIYSAIESAEETPDREKISEVLSRIIDELTEPSIAKNDRVKKAAEINAAMAAGFGEHNHKTRTDVIEKFPAQEFYREEDRVEWRDWPVRWADAGGQFFPGTSDYPEGRMIALKNDPIWYAISAFGNPYPPFDYNSGMGIRDVSREEALELGLIQSGEMIGVDEIQFNDGLEFSSSYSQDIERQLLKDLGADWEEEDGSIIFTNRRSQFLEKISNNCGTGDGGFQPGNTCAKSSGGELSDDERSAVKEYQSGLYRSDVGGYANLQSVLRRGVPEYGDAYNEERGGAHLRNLKSAFDKSSLQSDVVAYRGIRVKRGEESILKLSVGDVFTDKGVVSASMSRDVVKKKFLSKLNPSDKLVQVEFELPSGTKAIRVGGVTGADHEKEIAVAPGTNFKVTSRSERGGVVYLKMKAVASDDSGADSKLPNRSNPEPTEAQKEAGNYKKKHIRIEGLDVAIENEKGSVRSGVDKAGNEWETVMPADYGYIKRTEGNDGDHVDIYVGDEQGTTVFIVDQIHPHNGEFDEHKCLIGFRDIDDALDTYCRGFSDGSGPDRIGGVQQLAIEEFKDWLKHGDISKPVSDDLKNRLAGEDAILNMGGPGSGNWGHAGRPGQKGGSMPKSHGVYNPLKHGQYDPKKDKNSPDYEPKSYIPKPKWKSAGAVVYNDEGKIAIIKPKGNFGGYEWTFPKGSLEENENPEDAAHREVAEESGLKGELGDHLGAHEGTMSVTDYYLMKHNGSGAAQDGETQEVKWVSPEEAAEHLHSVRDLRVLVKAMAALQKAKKISNRLIPDDALSNNCGTGAGGFQPGNTCAKGGGQNVIPRPVDPEKKSKFGGWRLKVGAAEEPPGNTPAWDSWFEDNVDWRNGYSRTEWREYRLQSEDPKIRQETLGEIEKAEAESVISLERIETAANLGFPPRGDFETNEQFAARLSSERDNPISRFSPKNPNQTHVLDYKGRAYTISEDAMNAWTTGSISAIEWNALSAKNDNADFVQEMDSFRAQIKPVFYTKISGMEFFDEEAAVKFIKKENPVGAESEIERYRMHLKAALPLKADIQENLNKQDDLRIKMGSSRDYVQRDEFYKQLNHLNGELDIIGRRIFGRFEALRAMQAAESPKIKNGVSQIRAEAVETLKKPVAVYRGIQIDGDVVSRIRMDIESKGYYDLPANRLSSWTTREALAKTFARHGQGKKSRGGESFGVVIKSEANKGNVWMHPDQPIYKKLAKERQMVGDKFNSGGSDQKEVVIEIKGGKIRLTKENTQFL